MSTKPITEKDIVETGKALVFLAQNREALREDLTITADHYDGEARRHGGEWRTERGGRLRTLRDAIPALAAVAGRLADAVRQARHYGLMAERMAAAAQRASDPRQQLAEACMRESAACEEVARLRKAHATLAAFARTAPGRLPAEVQEAVDLAPWDGRMVRELDAARKAANEKPGR